ncbi:MAG: hypothetical protein HFH36_01275 [Lachnospiraceae bacterium]|nr:hypothetical protein [Lachnospiraceae bacterium]
MIRFLDKEVACIGIESYERDKMLLYFLNRKSEAGKRETEIVLVYDGAEYFGFATYDSVLGRKGENGILISKYIHTQEEELFCGLHRIFEDESEEAEYVPVFDKDMQLLYFAYQYESIPAQTLEKYVFPLLENYLETFQVKDLYPDTKKISIYDFNEAAFQFYNILKKQAFPVEVFGEKWAMLCPQIYEKHQIKFGETLSHQVLNIYAEGSSARVQENRYGRPGYELSVGDCWGVVFDIGEAVVFSELEKLKLHLHEKGLVALTMIFPDLRRLGYRTADEFYRNKESVSIGTVGLNEQNPLIVQQIQKCWQGDGEDKLRNAISVMERMQNQSIMVGNESVNYKCFGNGRHSIYLIGPCIVAGRGVDSEDSFGSCVCQEMQKITGGRYKVKCLSTVNFNIDSIKNIVESLTLYEGDIVVLIQSDCLYEKGKDDKVVGYPGDIDMAAILGRRETDWFWDVPIHTNQRGNQEIAKALAREYLLEYLVTEESEGQTPDMLQLGKCLLPDSAERELEIYTDNVRAAEVYEGQIGAIVMNCNPMTLGHRYLIEQALDEVDFLYVFLVEEDKSEFPFADRLEIVKAVTRNFANIKVVPSGRFILSYETMPMYFEKAERQEELLDAAGDLKIFGEKIAPRLGINVRFVGEEPNDRITYQYNESMKQLLPAYGIRLVEIPRLSSEDIVVSASLVRKYLHEGKTDLCRELVPEETYQYLMSNYK